MVKRGFVRAFGSKLRQIIAGATNNRIQAFVSGLGVTTLLQSSTATILLLISFAKSGMISLTAALAVVIGADVGTTLVAQILSFDLSFLSPALLSMGIITYMSSKEGALRVNIARIMIGLGLMLLSLDLVRDAVVPIKQSDILPSVLGALGNDTIFTILIAALLTWLIHSSLASVLLFASFIASGLIDMRLGLLLMLGANLGGAFVPLFVTWKDGMAARRITMANLFMRAVSIIIILPFLNIIPAYLSDITNDPMRQAIHFHTGFNIGLAVIFLPLVHVIARLSRRVIKDDAIDVNAPLRPQFLDDRALDTPAIALSNAARETLHMAQKVEAMLSASMTAFETGNKNFVDDVRADDDMVDLLYRAIKLHLAELSQESMTKIEAARMMQILTFSTNLEHIGDIIDKSLMDLAQKKIRKDENFSPEGLKEIQDFHAQVLENLRLSQNVFMTQDHTLAERLIKEKRRLRDAANETTDQHFKRLSAGVGQSIATSSLHLDIIRDYRRINTYISRLAYTVLDH